MSNLEPVLEYERLRMGLSKTELAKKIGIDPRTYQNYLYRKSAIPAKVLVKFADLYNCPTDYLLGRLFSKEQRTFVPNRDDAL